MEALSRTYTWTDYIELPGDQRWEILGGKLYNMSPGPSTRHQQVSVELTVQIHRALRSGDCRVFAAPIDVKLSDQDVVQPDILVVCDPSQILENYIEGPPKLVIEILSPSTQAHDRVRKMRLYAKSGVQEYWLVQPEAQTLEIFHLRDGLYTVAATCTKDESLTSPSFPDWEIDLQALFAHG